VIAALAEAKTVSLQQRELTPLYIDWLRVSKWDGHYPTTVLGSESSIIFGK
jgi:hypothetical protein